MAEGVDVSHHQGLIDWGAALRSGISFVYVKLTEGVGYTDPKADLHIKTARTAGTLVGGYHFARPDTNGPEAEGAAFGKALAARGLAQPGALPPCLDMERYAPGNLIDWSQRFIAAMRKQTGYQPVMVYASSSWWRDRYGGGAWLDASTWAWVAHYGREAGDPGFKTGKVVMHQYTSSGRIAGYGSNIDRNYAWVDLASLTGIATPPAPTPPPAPAPTGTYTVKGGDSLSGIAAKLGIAGGWQALYDANRDRITNPNVIQAGWVLRLPTGAPAPQDEFYIVRSGDSLSAIATRLHVAGGWQAIYNANRDKISNPNRIQAGWRLRIPR